MILGFVPGHLLHSLQGDPETVHSADQADAHADEQHPDAKIKSLTQLNCQNGEACQRQSNGKAQLSQPDDHIEVLHTASKPKLALIS